MIINIVNICCKLLGVSYGFIYQNDNGQIGKYVEGVENTIDLDNFFLLKDYSFFNKNLYINNIKQNEGNNNEYYSNIPIINLLSYPLANGEIIIILINKSVDFNDDDISLLKTYNNIFNNLYEKYVEDNEIYKEIPQLDENNDDIILSNMSHEIRTPLNGIIGYIQLLNKTKLDDLQSNYLLSVNSCCYQLLQIVNDVLDYSKLNAGKISITEETFYISELFEAVEDILGVSIKSKKQIFIRKVSKKVPPFILCDKQKIIQILINLVSNANKFTDIGSKIILKISIINDGILIFSVKDDGPGISERDKSKLFNVFSQLKNTSKIKGGAGLGLVICKKLVKLLNGDIWVNSNETGSNFYFTIEYKVPQNYEEFIENNKKMLEGKHILVVDDNPNNRLILSEYLYSWGATPITCASPLEALSLIVKKRYDFWLGLIDICMPDINGVELAKQIKKEEQCFPMIALSSSKDLFIMSDFEYRLEKPINKYRLFSVIIKTLERNTNLIKAIKRKSNPIINNEKIYVNYKILITDDNFYSLSLLQDILRTLKYKNLSLANDGEEAIKKIDESFMEGNPFDVIFLDLRMPKIDGYGVIEHIYNMGYNIPIVVTSASVLEDERKKCEKYKVKYFIAKPIQIKNIVDILNNL